MSTKFKKLFVRKSDNHCKCGLYNLVFQLQCYNLRDTEMLVSLDLGEINSVSLEACNALIKREFWQRTPSRLTCTRETMESMSEQLLVAHLA